MKKSLAIFTAGTVVGGFVTTTVIVRVVVPLIDPHKIAEKISNGLDKARYGVERVIFGEVVSRKSVVQLQLPDVDHRYIKSSANEG